MSRHGQTSGRITGSSDHRRILVGPISSPTKLHWIDADQDSADIHTEIQAMLAKSHEPVAEEWAIHDYEGFFSHRLSEYESIEKVAAAAELIAEHGALGAALLSHFEYPESVQEALTDNYQGAFDSPAAWAEQFLEDTGSLSQVPEPLRGYFDFEAYARDAEMSGDIFVIEADHQHHVFWSR